MKPVNLVCGVGLMFGTLTCMSPATIHGQVGTAFSYQGYLLQSSQPADGPRCLEFRLFDAQTNGAQVGPDLNPCNVPVKNR